MRALLSIHGIGEKKVRVLREKENPNDGRGIHSNMPHQIPDEFKQKVSFDLQEYIPSLIFKACKVRKTILTFSAISISITRNFLLKTLSIEYPQYTTY